MQESQRDVVFKAAPPPNLGHDRSLKGGPLERTVYDPTHSQQPSSSPMAKKATQHSFTSEKNQVNPWEAVRAWVIRETSLSVKTEKWQVKTIRGVNGLTGTKVNNKKHCDGQQ